MPGLLQVDQAAAIARDIRAAVDQVVIGRPDQVRLATIALVSGQHLLLQDDPGVGKTLLANALARSVGATVGRVQGTADLLPSDISGFSAPGPATDEGATDVGGGWSFRPGPVFRSLVLFDELHRASPRAQAALLEPMEEGTSTVDGVRRALPPGWTCIATRNPDGERGTFTLAPAILDRFGLAIGLGQVGLDVERRLLLGAGGTPALAHLDPVTDAQGLVAVRTAVAAVETAPALVDYVLALVGAVRQAGRSGPSTRAVVSLLSAARGSALVGGRPYVTADDVQAVVVASLAHRISAQVDALGILRHVLDVVPVPVVR